MKYISINDIIEPDKNALLIFLFQESARFSNIAFRTVYQMLYVITSKFDHERLDGIAGIYSVTAAVLMHPENIAEFFEKPRDKGIYVIFQGAAQHFPQYFTVFSRIVECLSACGPKYIQVVSRILSSFCMVLALSLFHEEIQFYRIIMCVPMCLYL